MTDGTAAAAGSGIRPYAPIDVEAERVRTPGSTTRHHFNSAGAALQTRETVDAVVRHLRLEEAEGGYEAAKRAQHLTEMVYSNAALLIGAHSDEIALFDSATTAMRSVLDALRLGHGRKVIVSRSTYVSQALQLLTMRAENGVELIVLPNTADGSVDLDALERALAGTRDCVVCVAHIPTSSGVVEPVKAIGERVALHDGLFLLDATQSVGQLEVDVIDIGCDVLVTTGRKFLRAPRGTAFAYISRALLARLEPAAPDVRASVWTGEGEWRVERTARMLESWEHSVAGRIGLGVAIGQALDRGMESTAHYLQSLASQVRTRLAGLPGVVVTDPVAADSAIVTFRLRDVDDTVVYDQLKERNIHTICIPASHAQWDLGSRGLRSVLRASVHVYNDTNDVDALVAAVRDIASSGAVS